MTVTADPADGDREHGPSDTASMARPGVEDRIKHLLAAGVKDRCGQDGSETGG